MSFSIQTTRETYARDRPDILDRCLQFGRVGSSIRKGIRLVLAAPNRNSSDYEHDDIDVALLTAVGREIYLMDVKDLRAL